jgi:threonine/homoserine/homoserine lactone efflux protein
MTSALVPFVFDQYPVFLGVVVLAYASPGPDFVAVTAAALGGRRTGFGAACGVAVASLLWATAALAGLGLVIARIGWLYEAVRLAGAAYLVYLGGRMLIGALKPAPADEAVTARAGGFRAGFRRGLLVNLTNPKAAAFFGSLFVSLLPPAASVATFALALATVGVVAVGWFALVALLFSGARARHVYHRLRRGIDAAMGAVLVALGARLAATA